MDRRTWLDHAARKGGQSFCLRITNGLAQKFLVKAAKKKFTLAARGLRLLVSLLNQ